MKFLLSSIQDNFDDVWEYLGTDAAKKEFAQQCLKIAVKSNPNTKLAIVGNIASQPTKSSAVSKKKGSVSGLSTNDICKIYGVSTYHITNHKGELELIGTRVGENRGRPQNVYSKESVKKLAKKLGWEKALATPQLQEKAAQHFAETPNT